MKSAVHLFAIAAFSLAACSKQSDPPPPDPGTGPVEFIGSAACADCHESQFRDWRGSHHELAIQVATDTTVLGDFSGTEFDYYGKKTQFFVRDGEFVVRTENDEGDDQDFRVAYAFGLYPLQQYLVKFPGGRMQALPFAWDSRRADDGGQRWYHLYPDEYIGPDDVLHWTGHLQNWNYMCAECHSTNLVMSYDAATRTFDTTWSELSVGCEACHGPASEHRDQAIIGAFDEDYGLPVSLDDRAGAAWVMNPDTGIAGRSRAVTGAQQQPETCGRCHSRRGVIAAEYEYGKPLADTHRVALLDDVLYFADGQIQEEVYVYGSFVQSRMYQAGVTCSDCHNPHSAELKAGGEPSDICAQCHLPSRFENVAHGGHDAGDAACVDCHMASRTYMGVDDRRDHGFRIPRPDLSASIGVPNACEVCHADKDADWATEQIARWAGDDYTPKRHIGTAIAAGRQGPANTLLVEASLNTSFPAIGRATALTLLAPPFAGPELNAIAAAIDDKDPLLRSAAVNALQYAPPATRLEAAAKALLDPVRSVRLEAARVFADLRDLLPVEAARAFGPAAEEYRAANRMVASTPEGLASLGSFELSMGDAELALSYFEDALQLAPGNALLRHSTGLVLVRTGDHDEALLQLEKAHQIEPENARYVYVYGVALNSLGLKEDALTVLQDARAHFPDDLDIGWAVATMLRDAGRTDDARAVAAELAAQFPDNRDVLTLRDSLGAD